MKRNYEKNINGKKRTKKDKKSRTLGIIALGSLGDCLPLLSVAENLKTSLKGKLRCFLVINQENLTKIRALESDSGVNIRTVDIPILLERFQSKLERHAQLASNECTKFSSICHEMDLLLEACKGADMIAFNLFSIAGYHIADALPEVKARVCLSPAFAPCNNPSSATPAVRRLLRWARKRLENAEKGSLCFDELEHWMVPLFNPCYAEWRAGKGLRPNFLGDGPDPLPKSVPLLYGVSKSLCPRPGYYPESVQIAGPWYFPLSNTTQFPEEVQVFLDEFKGSIVCVDFGSMTSLFADDFDWIHLLNSIESALNQCDLHGVFLNSKRSEESQCNKSRLPELGTLTSAKDRETNGLDNSDIVLNLQHVRLKNTSFLPHDCLLPHCSILIHHGGSGTTAAAIRCGVPQIILPFAFDQFTWAEKIEWFDLGRQINPLKFPKCDLSLIDDIQHIISSKEIKRSCGEYKKQILVDAKNGMIQTVCKLSNILDEI